MIPFFSSLREIPKARIPKSWDEIPIPEVWDEIPALPSAQNSQVFSPVFFSPKLNSLVLALCFVVWIFLLSSPRKKLEIFPRFQQCLGQNRVVFPSWNCSRFLGKEEGKKTSGIVRERKIPKFQTPGTSRDFGEFFIPPG